MLFIVALEVQQLGPFALMLGYKIFRTAIDNINVPRSSCKVPRYFSPPDFNQIWSSSENFYITDQYPIWRNSFQRGTVLVHADETGGQTDERTDMTKLFPTYTNPPTKSSHLNSECKLVFTEVRLLLFISVCQDKYQRSNPSYTADLPISSESYLHKQTTFLN